MDNQRKRIIKVLLITKKKTKEEEFTEEFQKKGKEEKVIINSEEEQRISDEESACKLKQVEEAEAISEKKEEEAAAAAAAYIAIQEEEKAKEAVKGKENLINSEEEEQRISEKKEEEAAAAAAAYIAIQEEEKAKKAAKGKGKLINSDEEEEEEKQRISAAYRIKGNDVTNVRTQLQKIAAELNFQLEIMECNTKDYLLADDIQELDMGDIKFVMVDESFLQKIFLLITEVNEFVNLPFIFFSSDNLNWQLLQKTARYKKGGSAGISMKEVAVNSTTIYRIVEEYLGSTGSKDSSHSENSVHQEDGQEVVVVEELQQVQAEPMVEELQQVQAEPGPMILKKRRERDWDQPSD